MRPGAGSENFRVLIGEFGCAIVNLLERPIAPHIHAQYNWIIKLDGADAEFSIGTARGLLDDRTILIFNPMEEHAAPDLENRSSMILSLLIEPIWLGEVFSRAGMAPPEKFPKSTEIITDEIRRLAICLSIAISQTMQYRSGSALHLLRELATAMGRSYHEPRTVDRLSNMRPSDFRIHNALDFIRQNLGNRPTVEKIAKEVGLSRSRFFEQFKGCMGIPPQHYIDSTRVSCAMRLLTGSTASLAEISDELGFSAPTHFTRFFAEHMGIAPSTFRRNALSLNE